MCTAELCSFFPACLWQLLWSPGIWEGIAGASCSPGGTYQPQGTHTALVLLLGLNLQGATVSRNNRVALNEKLWKTSHQ